MSKESDTVLPVRSERMDQAKVTELHFMDLSHDIKRSILSYIIRPADLKVLCLTSKTLRELATPQLYRKMTLFIGGQRDVHISSMLSRDNPGIQHIRKIYLQLERTPCSAPDDSSDDESSDEDEERPVELEDIKGAARQAQFTVRLLLDFLPNDILDNFSWQNWEPFSLDNWVLLCKKQRKLKAIEVASVDKSYLSVIEKSPELLKNLTEVSSLHFYPETLDRLHTCQKMLEVYGPRVREMQLSPGFQFVDGPTPVDLHDSSTRPGLLFRTIFSHMLPLESCTPISLKKLTLDNIDVRYAADTYMKAIDFSVLESLVVGGCAGADAVFSQMSKPHIRPSRLKKIRWFHEESAEPHALEAFEGLLEALSGLEILHVDLNNIGGLPAPKAIVKHSPTLRILALRSRYPRETEEGSLDSLRRYEPEQLDEICTQCTELRQLSVTSPTTYASDPASTSAFNGFLRSLAKLPHLTTLALSRWPQTRHFPFITNYSKLKPRAFELYTHHLQRLARQMFEASDVHSKAQGWGLGHRSKLAVIAFGGNGSTQYNENLSFKLKQMPFVRGTRVTPFGVHEMEAVRVRWKEVAWIEAESDVLNHSMYDLEDVHHTP